MNPTRSHGIIPSVLLAAGLLAAVAFLQDARRLDAAEPPQPRSPEEEGLWPEAVLKWEAIAATATDPAEERVARLALWRALAAVGDYGRLERETRAALRTDPGSEEAVLPLARSLAATGRPHEAIEVLDPFVPRSLPATALSGELLLVVGEEEESDRRMQQVLDRFDPGRASPAQMFAAARAAEGLGSYQRAVDLYELTVRDSIQFVEPRLRLAMLLFAKDQTQLAQEELGEAGKLAQNHPDVQVTWARISLLNMQLLAAERAARSALRMRPADPGASVVLARLALIAQDPDQARDLLEEPYRRNPTDREVLSMLAAAHYVAGDSAAYHAAVDRVLAQDPRYRAVHLDLARILEIDRRNEEALSLYRRVLAEEPGQPDALIAMGLLLMREGEEEEARAYLEEGFAGDPFDIRAFNQLTLLDKMDTFRRVRTENFEIRLDAEADSLLVPLLEETLEKIYLELVPLHGWTPDLRTVVEIFPSHEWFSARVTGLPWIGGIPAVCFGHVVASDSPRTLSGNTNWEDVLRHEFGHVLALGMTDKRVPFWFTEGLSVYLERFPRGRGWDRNLVGAYVDGELVSVDSLTIAFTRPRSMGQRMLAYHEAGLIVEDLVERKGWDSVPRLLQAFGEGQRLEEALPDVIGESYASFSNRSMQAVREEAAALPVWPRPDPDRLDRLLAEENTRGDDPGFLRLLAITQFQLMNPEAANVAAKRLLAVAPEDPTAVGMLGLTAVADPAVARKHFSRAVELGSRDLPVYAGLARLVLAEKDTAAALGLYAASLDLYPYQPEVRLARARLLLAGGDAEAARENYELLLTETGEAGEGSLELARLELREGRGDAAARALEYAVSIYPLQAEVEALRAQAYLLLDRDEVAYELLLRARRLDIRSVETMVGMAQYYFKRGDTEEAAYFARLALKYDPEHPVAREILDRSRES
jgi:tetratricopeptide (TPR) repeat protein